jgi:hypothetical protein
MVLPAPRSGGGGSEGTVLSAAGVGTRCVMDIGGIGGGGCRVREALRARTRDDERGGTLPGGMLYMLEMLNSAGLGGDGVLLVGRPRCTGLAPLLSMLAFLSGSLFSAKRVSILGRLDATDAFWHSSERDVLRSGLPSAGGLRDSVSARLGSVSSRMSDRGRVLAHEEQ